MTTQRTNILAMNTLVVEILDLVNNSLKDGDIESAVYYLKNCRVNSIVEGYLRMNFDRDIKFNLPEGQTPYKVDETVPEGYGLSDLKQEFRRMYIFTDPKSTLSSMRRESLWIQTLEGLNHREAKLLDAIKDKELSTLYPNITKEFLVTVFPSFNVPSIVGDAPVVEETVHPVVAEEVVQEETLPVEKVVEDTPAPTIVNPEPIVKEVVLDSNVEALFEDVEPEVLNKLTPEERLSLYNSLKNFDQDSRWYNTTPLINPDPDDLIGSFGRDMTSLLDEYILEARSVCNTEAEKFFTRLNELYSVSKKLD